MLNSKEIQVISSLLSDIKKVEGCPEAVKSKVDEALAILSVRPDQFVEQEISTLEELRAALPVVCKVTGEEFGFETYCEPGMMLVITGIRMPDDGERSEMFSVHLDMTPFDLHNQGLLIPEYYPNRHTQAKVKAGEIPESNLYTAKDAGYYELKFTEKLSYFQGQGDDQIVTTLKEDLIFMKRLEG